jgi:hypothetical protein
MEQRKHTFGKIFISYRRADARGEAGRLGDSLTAYFGDNRIFRDVGGIGGGQDFGEVILTNLQDADAVIVLIGNQWLNINDESGQRRLDDPEDWVMQEVAAALESSKLVLPVLVEGAQMPRAEELPDRLKPLAMRNALSISDLSWEADVKRLAQILALDIPSATERNLFWVKLTASLALAVPMVVTIAILAWNLQEAGTDVLALWHSAINFIGIVFSSMLLLGYVNLVDSTRIRYVNAAVITGAAGSLLFFLLFWILPEEYEVMPVFFGSYLISGAMFIFMVLSGFKSK